MKRTKSTESVGMSTRSSISSTGSASRKLRSSGSGSRDRKSQSSPTTASSKASDSPLKSRLRSKTTTAGIASSVPKAIPKANKSAPASNGGGAKPKSSSIIESLKIHTLKSALQGGEKEIVDEEMEEELQVDDWEGLDVHGRNSSDSEGDSEEEDDIADYDAIADDGDLMDDDDAMQDQDEYDQENVDPKMPMTPSLKDRVEKLANAKGSGYKRSPLAKSAAASPLVETQKGREMFSAKKSVSTIKKRLVNRNTEGTSAEPEEEDKENVVETENGQEEQDSKTPTKPSMTRVADLVEDNTPLRRSKRSQMMDDTPEILKSTRVVETPDVEKSAKKREINRILAEHEEDEKSDEDSQYSSSSEDEEEEQVEQVEEEEGMDVAIEGDSTLPFQMPTALKIKGGLNATTSNATLKFAALGPTEYSALLDGQEDGHAVYKDRLIDLIKLGYPQWQFEVSCDFNLLFYGYGSKIDLVTEFVDTMLNDGPTITINGFFPTCSFRQVLSKMVTKIARHEGPLGTPANQVKILQDYMSSPTRAFPYITLLIHNIESPPLATESTQFHLATLASSPNIYLVCTIDHINAPLLWPISLITLFNFAWHDVTNYTPYTLETSFENSLVCRGVTGRSGILATTRHVLASVNAHAKKLFLLLARNNTPGLSFDVFFQKAVRAFVAQEVNIFRTLLTEFKDHGMVVAVRDEEGGEVLRIPIDDDALAEVVEELEAAGVRV